MFLIFIAITLASELVNMSAISLPSNQKSPSKDGLFVDPSVN